MHAFLNLIMNSIDAFSAYGKRRNRKIEVRIMPSNYAEVSLTYTDNAAGIDSSKIYCNGVNSEIPLKELIFQPGITSKKDQGSGFGLYLVRQILTEHGGSIDLISHRNGVQFKIILPHNAFLE